MSPAPAEPARLHDLVEAFAQSTQAVVELARQCTHDDLHRPTDCPGWTVHDQISHVVGVEAWLAGRKDPRVEIPAYEHIKSDFSRRVEHAVQVRRPRTGAELVAELEDVLEQRLLTLRSPTLTNASIIAGPFGPEQADIVMLLRIFDVWTHEQDIRCALGTPGDLASPAAAICVSSIMQQLPKRIAQGDALKPGQRLVMDVTGPVTARQSFQVAPDQEGRLRGHAVAERPSDPSTTTISLSTEAFTRRAAGRRLVRETAYSVLGDDSTAGRVLEALVVTI